MDIVPGDVTSGILKNRADSIIARNDTLFTIDEKDRDMNGIKRIEQKRKCAVHNIMHRHLLYYNMRPFFQVQVAFCNDLLVTLT
jgi:hypothetical protein